MSETTTYERENNFRMDWAGRVVWLCPECFLPSESGPTIPDEENRPCDHGFPLAPFVQGIDARSDEPTPVQEEEGRLNED